MAGFTPLLTEQIPFGASEKNYGGKAKFSLDFSTIHRYFFVLRTVYDCPNGRIIVLGTRLTMKWKLKQ